MIIDPPDDPYDVAAWQERIASLKEARAELETDLYDALMTSLQAGLAAAQAGPQQSKAGTIRETARLGAGR